MFRPPCRYPTNVWAFKDYRAQNCLPKRGPATYLCDAGLTRLCDEFIFLCGGSRDSRTNRDRGLQDRSHNTTGVDSREESSVDHLGASKRPPLTCSVWIRMSRSSYYVCLRQVVSGPVWYHAPQEVFTEASPQRRIARDAPDGTVSVPLSLSTFEEPLKEFEMPMGLLPDSRFGPHNTRGRRNRLKHEASGRNREAICASTQKNHNQAVQGGQHGRMSCGPAKRSASSA